MLLMTTPLLAYGKLEIGRTFSDRDTAFTKESTNVLVMTKPIIHQKGKSLKLILLQVDSDGNKIKYMGIMSDDGIMGDRSKKDGIYTRKIQVYGKKGGIQYFAVTEEIDGKIPQKISDMSKSIQIKVIFRPSFIELMERVFTQMGEKKS